jgi:hypothetical protein
MKNIPDGSNIPDAGAGSLFQLVVQGSARDKNCLKAE